MTCRSFMCRTAKGNDVDNNYIAMEVKEVHRCQTSAFDANVGAKKKKQHGPRQHGFRGSYFEDFFVHKEMVYVETLGLMPTAGSFESKECRHEDQ